ncbi:MAG: hypothetical protein E7598_00100 [Ruminococcaceae bacterium]|nr:hypothetical protein [Oscillospiraceae bacterium]
MSIYKRYNTRRKKVPRGLILCILAVLVAFALTAMLGHHLAQKAAGGEALYTGTSPLGNGGTNLAPLSEKSILGQYVEPKDIANFTTDNTDVCASVWLYKDGKSTFATEADELLGKEQTKLPDAASLDIKAKTIGLFEVSSIYADEKVKSIVTEYELSLLKEFANAGLDETVLVFNEVNEENFDEIFAFAEKANGAKVVCVPYSTLENSAFFSEAASKQLPLAIKADTVTKEKLEEDINTYSFYFTRYNLRLVLEGNDKDLLDVLAQNTLLNYQFASPIKEGK